MIKRTIRIAIVLGLLFLATVRLPAQGKLLDQVVAVVDGSVITFDEWQQQARFDALIQGLRPTEIVLTEACLNRLIDRVLIDKNRASINFTAVTPAEVDQQLTVVRKQIADAKNDEAWHGLLANYQLTQDEVKEQLEEQLDNLRFVDKRFRPGARVTPEQVNAYYRDTFVPKFQKQAANAKPPALADVTDRITSILTEQLMDQRFANWLQNLRAQARIQQITPLGQNAPPPLTH